MGSLATKNTKSTEAWPRVRLGEVCEIIAGQSPEGCYYTNESQYTEFHQGSKNFGKWEIEPSGVYTKQITKVVEAGTILISVRAPVGDINLTPRRICIGRGLAALLPNDSLDRDFLCRFLSGATKELNDVAGPGACFNSISKTQLSNLEIPLPPLSVQREIVARLEKELASVDRMVKGFEEMKAEADQLFKAELKEAFEDIKRRGARVKRLDEIFEIITDGTHNTPTYCNDAIDGVKFLSSKDVTSGKIDWSNIRYIPHSLHLELCKRVSPRRGDILLAKNGTTGVAAIVDTDDVFDIYVSLALLRPNPGNNLSYLWHAINSPYLKEQFDGSLKGIGVPNLHLVEIRKAQMPLPPLATQREIVAKLDAVREKCAKLKSAAEEGLKTAALLRKAILKEAFE